MCRACVEEPGVHPSEHITHDNSTKAGWVFGLVVKKLVGVSVFHIIVPGFGARLQLLTQASCKCKPKGTVAMPHITGFLFFFF